MRQQEDKKKAAKKEEVNKKSLEKRKSVKLMAISEIINSYKQKESESPISRKCCVTSLSRVNLEVAQNNGRRKSTVD